MKNILFLLFILLIGCTLSNPQNNPKYRCKDTNNDGKTDYWVHYVNENDILTKIDEDYDGKPDVCDQIKEINSKVLSETDFDYDGIIEAWSEDSDGYLKTFFDTNRDGFFDFKGYAKNKILQRVELDLNYDGQMDAFKIYQNGNLMHCEIDANYDGNIDEKIDSSKEFNSWKRHTYPEYTRNFNDLKSKMANGLR